MGRGARRGRSAGGRGDAAAAGRCRRPAGAPFTQAMAARAGRRAVAGLRLRALRGHRPAGARRRREPGCGSTRSRLGDYVLNGGEVAVLVDRRGGRPAAARRARQRRVAGRGVARRDGGLLEGPVYTKPAELARPRRARRCCSPATTRAIARWRRDEALRRTAARRPDLLDRARPGRAGPRRPAPLLAELGWAAGRGRAIGPHRRRLWQTEPLLSPAARRPCHREGASRTARADARQLTPTHRG